MTFDGPLTTPRIFNETLDREMVLNMTLALGDQVIIDMQNKTIIQGGFTNRLDKKTGDSKWWWLDPGSNLIIFSTTASGDTGSCKIGFRDSYIGV
ncbi:MAG: phage tail family protein [Proteobacteria bacterium]|nr:phage tail family protein [Pseudomonadota bacterium]